MNGKTIAISLLACVCTFFLGWGLHQWVQANTFKPQETSGLPGPKIVPSDNNTTDVFFKGLSGRFVLEESNCAGFNFINTDTVLWTNELFCNDPDTLKYTWLSDSLFMTRSTYRINENCPPKVGIYKIISFEKQQFVLMDIWTGWYDSEESYIRLIKK